MEAFVLVDELQGRLDFVMDELERGVAAGALEDLSVDARAYGRPGWTMITAPAEVKSLILRAAARFMRNYEGLSQSRAGDETLIWQDTDRQADTAEFSEDEKVRLRAYRGGGGLTTAPVVAWSSRYAPRDIRVWDGGSTIPLIAKEEADFVLRVIDR